ncbi:hypothetical protein B0H14DRAFT_979507 [Mycena olivaceomarginata]|nr:hypothetical protein B0H14DRAFT_979507 [Mycena olivaceomarginata]
MSYVRFGAFLGAFLFLFFPPPFRPFFIFHSFLVSLCFSPLRYIFTSSAAILRVHTTSAFQALELSSLSSLATPPSIQQSRASSDASDAFSALSTPASLERSIRRAPRPARPLAARGAI